MYVSDHGTDIRVHAGDPPATQPAITAATYFLRFDQEIGFYLEKHKPFEPPSKIYGDTCANRDRIMTTFESRSDNTGILLSGEKGSGKTLLSKMIGIECIKRDIPVIIVSSAYCGDGFKSFLARVDQPYMLLFDEFEKVYDDKEKQNGLLSLLDGVVEQKRLTVMTTNNSHAISEYMKNRPGRIFYSLDFDGLSREFIKEYTEDHLVNKAHQPGLLKTATLFSKLNFDMLQSLIEEMNRYDEPALSSIEFLNIQPSDYAEMYDIRSLIDPEGNMISTKNHVNMKHPLISGNSYFDFNIDVPEVEEGEEEEDDYVSLHLTPDKITSYNEDEYTYLVDEYKVTIVKHVHENWKDQTKRFVVGDVMDAV